LLILACARIANLEEKMAADTKFWVALSRVPQLGTVRFRRLEANFGNLESAWNATYNELRANGLEDRPAQEIVAARNNSSPDDEMAAL
jgi:predicted Rossmann fold nucleotide-binding protein DprA/Smf involved in DNA uptake